MTKLRGAKLLRAAVVAGAACGLLFAGTLSAGAAAAASAPWHAAIQVPGLTALPGYGGNVTVTAVSCPSNGNCVAAGNYLNGGGGGNVFTAAEVNGTWHDAEELPVPALDDATTVSAIALSCPSVGNCAVGGSYKDTSGDIQAYTANEVNGTWQPVVEVLSTEFLTDENAEVLSISCPSAGNCTIGGDYQDGAGHRQAFVGDQRNGIWEAAQEAPGTAVLNGAGNAEVASVSCASAGNCAAGGYYVSGGGNRQAFVVSEKNHGWGSAKEVAGGLNTNGFAEINSVSCASAGNCGASGLYSEKAGGGFGEAFVITEINGAWGGAREVAGKLNGGGDGDGESISCRSAGNCTAVGFYITATKKGKYEGFVVSETKGSWGSALEVPGVGALNAGGEVSGLSVSCASAGNCAVVGNYNDKSNHAQAFVDGEAGGRWAIAAPIPGTIGLNKGGSDGPQAVSCAAAGGGCAVGGYYAATTSFALGFVAAGSLPQTSRSTLTLSAAKVTYGHEQRERITVTVSPQHSGKPSGTVTVSAGGTALCTFGLSSGKGSCTLSAKRLGVGKHSLTANYGGSTLYSASTSAAKTVTVVK